MRERYRQYRGYGHPVWVAAILAPPPEWFAYGIAIAVGLFLGVLIFPGGPAR